jgi:hypothetical protein
MYDPFGRNSEIIMSVQYWNCCLLIGGRRFIVVKSATNIEAVIGKGNEGAGRMGVEIL